jgi:glycosyltransferase involved in cell wall biosynthesis
MILIATDKIGGPGKGIFQFLRYADPERFSFLLCNFDPHWSCEGSFEFLERAQSERIAVHLLRQHRPIDVGLVAEAYDVIQRQGITLLQTHSYKANILGCLLKLRYRIPWIAFAHGYTGGAFRLHLYNRLDQFSYRFADRVVTVSSSLQVLLKHRGVRPERMRLIPNAIDPEDLQPRCALNAVRGTLKVPANEPLIAVIGRLSPEKGQRVFLQALRLLAPQFPSLRSLIVGEGPDEEKLRALAFQLGITEQVIFTGYRSDMPDLYKALDLVVIPSFSEGHPNVLLEAMACGIPVVSTDVGSVREVMGASGLVRPGTPTDLAVAIADVLRDPERSRELAKARQSEIRARFNPRRRAERILALYDEVLDLCNASP